MARYKINEAADLSNTKELTILAKIKLLGKKRYPAKVKSVNLQKNYALFNFKMHKQSFALKIQDYIDVGGFKLVTIFGCW